MGSKVDNHQPFPVKEQLPNLDFCVTSSPSWVETAFHGFQHYVLMLGTIVIVSSTIAPVMGGGNVEKAELINTLLFCCGINTLLQTLFGSRLPIVMGASYASVIPALSVALSNNNQNFSTTREMFKQSMRALQGALILASLLQLVFGFFGIWRIIARFFSPLAASPLVILTGLGLYYQGFPQLAKCVEIGLPTLLLIVFISQYLCIITKHSYVCEKYAVILSVVVMWIFAELLTGSGAYNKARVITQQSCRTDRAGIISGSPWVYLPYPFQWGNPTFKASDAFAMLSASFVALIETSGVLIAASRFGSATPLPPSILSRGVGWQGISTLINGCLGGVSVSTASVENTGLMGLTRVGSRRVVVISAFYMIFFSCFVKFGAVLASIPLPIFAALYCVLISYVAAAGLNLLQFCNLNSFRTMFILGISLFLGLSVPQYFNITLALSKQGPFNNMMQVVFSSPATVAVVVSFFLDKTHTVNQSSSRVDSGMHWWERFRDYGKDVRNEEFYALPWNLNKYFPTY